MPTTTLTAALAALNTASDIQVGDWLHTADGGIAKKYTNKTGAVSVKGTLVKHSGTTTESIDVADIDSLDHIGVIYEDGVADGSNCWVTIIGDAKILLENSTTSTVGNWVKPSATTAGRVDASNAAPYGGTIGALEEHFTEVGHAEETSAGGTDVLILVHLHFN